MDQAWRREARRAREAVAAGRLRGAALGELLAAVPYLDRDAWVDELLGIEPPPPDAALPPGAVPYLPCGVEEIVAAVREAPLRAEDQLVDLGAGLGRVVMLAHLLSGARASGVEIQAGLVRAARERAAALGLRSLEFVEGDATARPLDGSVFFLYAPCNGALLEALLARVEAVARRRPIVVCAANLELGPRGWLAPRPSSSAALTIYYSRPPL